MKPCRCGPSWLSANGCVCKSVPKAKQRRRVTSAAKGGADHTGETQQTKITRPTPHLILEEGGVRKVPGWHLKS